jgi:Response regulators consisting of a CheY-like receiver domain and a winged-helix DNA-binding domain
MTSILIVEDHPTMRDAMRLVLEEDGYEVEEATDGEAGIAAVRTRPPDIVLLDLNIPVASGAQVLETLKADPSTAAVLVVIVTAAGEEGRQRALALGADGYITKPFSPIALLRTVERVLRGSGPSGS